MRYDSMGIGAPRYECTSHKVIMPQGKCTMNAKHQDMNKNNMCLQDKNGDNRCSLDTKQHDVIEYWI